MNANTTYATEAPAYIAADDFTGKHMVTITGPRKGMKIAKVTARWIAANATEGVFFDSFGHGHGFKGEGFARNRYVATANGDLHCYDSEGAKKIVHPAERVIRILISA
jgi:hypothetical protein